MILSVLILVSWIVYVEVEMPNRMNECPVAYELCEGYEEAAGDEL